MRWTRNPVYPFPGIGGLNPSSSARDELAGMAIKVVGVCKFFFLWKSDKSKVGRKLLKLDKNQIITCCTVVSLYFIMPLLLLHQ